MTPTYAVVEDRTGATGYAPRGAALDFWKCRGHEVMLAGPAETGKTTAALHKLDALLWKYPGSQAVMVRKVRDTIRTSCLQTYTRKVLGEGTPVRAVGGESPSAFDYPNGSRLWLGGMDDPQKVLSSERDFVYVNQAEELGLVDWETLLTRCTGRAGNSPYPQVLGDCNPGPPHHWIRHRPTLRLFESRHEDNPTLWDAARGEWTEQGRRTLATLDSLTGVRRERLRYGRWVAAEGVVYEFDPRVHVADRFPIPPDWTRFRAFDFGFTHPFVCFDDRTEILTPFGWKFFRDVPCGCPVAAVDPHTHSLKWEVPSGVIDRRYSGPMVISEPNCEGANFCVTPNHQMVVGSYRTGLWSKSRADAMPAGTYIPVGWGPCPDEPDDLFEIPRSESARPNRRRLAPVGRVDFFRFLGLFLAEGCLHKSGRRGHPAKYVRIAQRKNIGPVRAILDALGWRYSQTIGPTGVIDFSIGSADLYDFLMANGGGRPSHLKRIPSFVFSHGRSHLGALLEGLMVGDGSPPCFAPSGVIKSSARYHTSSEGLADDVQAIASLLGMPSTIRTTARAGGYPNPSTDRMYVVRFTAARRAAVSRLPARTISYDGRVYCFTVPSGTLVVRRGGRPMVCGNCGWFALDPDGRLYRYREVYMTGRTVKAHAELVNDLSRGEHFAANVADHDAEDRATLAENGIHTVPARKEILPGIDAVTERLKVAADGKPRLLFLRDSLVERDESLAAAHKPVCTEQEFDVYQWPKAADGRPVKDVPVKLHDHGMDVVRYACRWADARERSDGSGWLTADPRDSVHARTVHDWL